MKDVNFPLPNNYANIVSPHNILLLPFLSPPPALNLLQES